MSLIKATVEELELLKLETVQEKVDKVIDFLWREFWYNHEEDPKDKGLNYAILNQDDVRSNDTFIDKVVKIGMDSRAENSEGLHPIFEQL